MKGTLTPGARCTVNRMADIYMEVEARDFIEEPCVIVKITKAGLVQVALEENSKQTYSFRRINIDLI